MTNSIDTPIGRPVKGLVEVGKHTYGHENISIFYPVSKLKIGSFCSIGAQVGVYLGGNHPTDWISTYPFQLVTGNCNIFSCTPQTSNGDVVIGNDVWIGNNVLILSGVRIGDGAAIGNSSLVANDIGPYEIRAGNKAVFIRKRFSDVQIEALLKIKWWDWEDEKIFSEAKLISSNKIDEFIKKHLKEA